MTNSSQALNAICPYFTMFPLQFPYELLRRHASQGEVVLDPFCGRGTTNYACRLLGLPSVGIDSSPVAVAISEAKIANIEPEAIYQLAVQILEEIVWPVEVPEGEFWEWAYHPNTLQTLCRLRESLLRDSTTPARKALRAIVLGALHGPLGKHQQTYFSNQMPRTYAPKPGYSVKYWKIHAMRPGLADVLRIIEERARRYYTGQVAAQARIVQGDSRTAEVVTDAVPRRAHWVVTSPPYYGMRTYIPDQWLRNWFMGGPATVDYSVTGQLIHSSPGVFADQLGLVWKNLYKVTSRQARLIFRFGGLNDRNANPLTIAKDSLRDSGWTIQTIRSAGSAQPGRRQAESFIAECEPPLTEYDIWAVRN